MPCGGTCYAVVWYALCRAGMCYAVVLWITFGDRLLSCNERGRYASICPFALQRYQAPAKQAGVFFQLE